MAPSPSAPRVLVLGATGRTGGLLLDLLAPDAAAGRLDLLAAVRSPERAAALAGRGVGTRVLDLDAPDTYEEALAGISRLFMVTGYTVDMLGQGKNLTDAARAAGVEHVVHVGTFHQPGRPSSRLVRHYIWHQLVEAYIERSGLGWTHLHPNAFMQNFLGALSGGRLRMFFGRERVGLVDCLDLAKVAAAALRDPGRHAGRRYYLSVEALTMDEAARVLAEELGRPVRYEPLPAEELRNLPIGATMEPAYFECIVRQMGMLQAGLLPDFADTYDNVEAITGEPPQRFREFVRRHRAAFAGT